jgi:hypothetical protein
MAQTERLSDSTSLEPKDLFSKLAGFQTPFWCDLRRSRKRGKSLLLRMFREIIALLTNYPCSPVQRFAALDWGIFFEGCRFSGFPVAHPVEGIDAAFRNLIFEEEIQRMKDSLGFLNLSLDEMIPFNGEPVALGTPTFEGEEGKKFWRILLSF